MDGEEAAVRAVTSQLLKPLANNFVERPWGGLRMYAYKSRCALPEPLERTDVPIGEAFEIAAYDADEEAYAHPSKLRFDDGSVLALPKLLRRHSDALLGKELADAQGGSFPLLPKTLDVRELLSVQGHPEGNTEVYVIIEADPGATIRVGFNRDVDPHELEEELTLGRARQQRLLELIGARCTPVRLQALLAPWLAAREKGLGDVPGELDDVLAGADRGMAHGLLEQLKALYWRVLDSMNEIAVAPGMIVCNANPHRIVAATGKAASAEVHALGNPEGRELLALEIRRPGPTFRAWDNVRFPLRRIDVQQAIRSLNLKRVAPDELIVDAQATERAGVFRSVVGEGFTLEHLRPRPGVPVEVPAEPIAHSLHAISGSADVHADDGRPIASLCQGESALVPIGVGTYHVSSHEGAEIVKVSLAVTR